MIIQDHWNKTVRRTNSTKSRDYIVFSDLGRPFIDRYWKMKGEPVTNDFEDRVLRIFDGGKISEIIVLRALVMAGLLNQKNKYVEIPATEKRLRQMGFLDCTIGGHIDFAKAKRLIEEYLTTYNLKIDNQLIEQKALNIIEGMKDKYNGEMEEMLVEVKSINSMSFWAHKNRDINNNFIGYPHNELQAYGYMKATGLEKGILLYLSRDDYVMHEVGLILGNERLEKMYAEDVETMTEYYLTDKEPPKEQEVVYEERERKFAINWRVARSVYLTKIYGYPDAKALEEKHHAKLLEVNLALKHLREFEKEKDEKKKATLEKKIKAEDLIIKSYKLYEKK